MRARRVERREMGRRWRALATAGLVLVAASCRGEPVPDDEAAADQDMELALQDDQAEPQLEDVGDAAQEGGQAAEPTPAPARPRPTPPPAPAPAPTPPPAPAPTPPPAVEPEPEAPRMATYTAQPGAEFQIELRQELSTKTNVPGDRFTATVVSPMIDGNRVVLPNGAVVRGEVTAVQKSGGQGQTAIIKVAFLDVAFNGETWPIAATVVEATPETQGRYSTGDKAARIGAGAVAGAILGRVIGGNAKGTVIGAAVGAAAGTAITLATEDVDAVLPEGSTLRLRLDEPFSITVPESPGG